MSRLQLAGVSLVLCLVVCSGGPVADTVTDPVPSGDVSNASAPVAAAAAKPKLKKRKKVAKHKKKAVKKPSTLDAVRASWSSFRNDVSRRYKERVEYLEAQAELSRLERQRQEARLRARLAQLRAEAEARQADGADEDEHEDAAAAAAAAAELENADLTLSERAALIGSLIGSPGGIVGVVLGGAAGGAAGYVVEKVEQVGSSVSRTYAERVQSDQYAAEQQEAVSEELRAVSEVSLVDNGVDAEELAACREQLLGFLAAPCNRRCADCTCKLPTLQAPQRIPPPPQLAPPPRPSLPSAAAAAPPPPASRPPALDSSIRTPLPCGRTGGRASTWACSCACAAPRCTAASVSPPRASSP